MCVCVKYGACVCVCIYAYVYDHSVVCIWLVCICCIVIHTFSLFCISFLSDPLVTAQPLHVSSFECVCLYDVYVYVCVLC